LSERKIATLLLIVIGASFLQIWRGAGHSRFDGVNLWQLLRDSTLHLEDGPFGYQHIRYEVAVMRAREAYQEKLRREVVQVL